MTNAQAILISASVLAAAVVLSGNVSSQVSPPPAAAPAAEGPFAIAGPHQIGSPVWFRGPAMKWPVLCRGKNIAAEGTFVECFDFYGAVRVDSLGNVVNR